MVSSPLWFFSDAGSPGMLNPACMGFFCPAIVCRHLYSPIRNNLEARSHSLTWIYLCTFLCLGQYITTDQTSSIEVPGIELVISDLAARTFTHWALLLQRMKILLQDSLVLWPCTCRLACGDQRTTLDVILQVPSTVFCKTGFLIGFELDR